MNKMLGGDLDIIQSSCVKNILSILLGIVLFFIGMYIIRFLFGENVLSSYINIINLTLSTWFVAKRVNLGQYIGDSNIKWLILICVIISLFNLIYSVNYVFLSFTPHSESISIHPEHSLSYYRMSSIASVIINEEPFSNLDDLYLNQYKWLYIYYSLMFVSGGDVVTHICVFNMFHQAISAIIMVLIAVRLNISNKSHFNLICLLCLLQPMLCCLFAYHRDIVGQTCLSLGLYIYISTFKNPTRNLLCFPVYGVLFYIYRLQYLVVAVVLCFFSFIKDTRRDLSFWIGLSTLAIVSIFYLSTLDLTTFFLSDLNIEDYVNSDRKSFVGNLIEGFVGYFPWTNLAKDINWSYHLYACLQAPMNIVILWYVFKSNDQKFNAFYCDPMFLCASLLFIIAFFCAGHTSYVSVAMPIFALSISQYSFKNVYISFLRLVAIFTIGSFLYSTIGLSGILS